MTRGNDYVALLNLHIKCRFSIEDVLTIKGLTDIPEGVDIREIETLNYQLLFKNIEPLNLELVIKEVKAGNLYCEPTDESLRNFVEHLRNAGMTPK